MLHLLPKNLLPEEWRNESFIAGGYAADSTLANDVDVWVTVPVANSLAAVRLELLAHLEAQGFEFVTSVIRTVDEEVALGYSIEVGGELFLDNCQVVVVTGRRNGGAFVQPIHLIVTNGDVDDVLSGFDISTHQLALVPQTSRTPEFGTVYGEGWTSITEEPVVLRDTPHTADRLKKITARYAHMRGTALAEG